MCVSMHFSEGFGEKFAYFTYVTVPRQQRGGGRGRVDIKWNGPDSGLVMQVIQIETDLVLDKVFIITLHILFNFSQCIH